MKIRYTGPNKAVQIAATRQWAEPGVPLDVDSKVAKELVKQPTWEKVTEKTKDSDEG